MNAVCYFGIYKSGFIRNAVLIKGFKENGYEVVECSVDPGLGGIRKFISLYKKGRALKREHMFEHVVVGFPGHSVVWLARLLFGKSIIFDAFLSQYDANVFDRKKYGRWHPLAFRDWLLDWSACTLAWKVLLPENVHIEYFVRTFGIPKRKFIRVFTGANTDVFYPRSNVHTLPDFTVHFHGTFIPLQGVQYILDAANKLRDQEVRFQIVGAGGTLYEKMQEKARDLDLQNVTFEGRKPLEEVPEYIARAHVCLGVFGDTHKTRRVISNKIYECLAMGKPVITSRTPATEELLSDRENVLFAEPADGRDLAEKILTLKEDHALAKKIAEGAFALFSSKLTPRKLVAELLEDLSI